MSYVRLVTCLGCELCEKCMSLCDLWNVEYNVIDTHLTEHEGETYPIIYLNGEEKITYEDFCERIMKGEVGK